VAKKLKDIPTFTKQFWKKLGDETADRIRVHTTKGGKDVNNKTFKPYSTSYKARKVSDKFTGQSSRSSKPDLQLTGDMMINLQTRGFSRDNVAIARNAKEATSKPINLKIGK